MSFKSLSFTIFLLSLINNIIAQKSYPITRDTANRYFNFLSIEGKIINKALAIPCGITCSSGILKVKLTRKSSDYHSPFIFIAIPCFSTMPKLFLKKRNWVVTKIPLADNSCYFTSSSLIDSGGLPFYTLRSEPSTNN